MAYRRGVSSARPGLPLAAVAVTLLLWASAFVAIRHLGADFSPGALSLGRLAVGSVLLGVVSLTRGWVRPTRREWGAIAAIGLLWYAVYNVALNAGELLVDAGTAALLIQVSPLLIAVLAAWLLGERFTGRLALGLALAFAGVLVIGLAATPATAHPRAGGAGYAWGVALCLVSAAAYSVSVILQKPLVARLPAVQVTWLACSVGALVCLPFAGRLAQEAALAPAASLWWVGYLGVFPTAVAFTTYAFALRHMPASSLGATTYLVPGVTILLGWLFLSEVPAPLAYLGGALALVGVAVARSRSRAPVAPEAAAVLPVTEGGHREGGR